MNEIVWAILGSLGTFFLGLISWGMKKWITATFDNTVAVKHLTDKLSSIEEKISDIPRLKKGMAILFDKLNDKPNGGLK